MSISKHKWRCPCPSFTALSAMYRTRLCCLGGVGFWKPLKSTFSTTPVAKHSNHVKRWERHFSRILGKRCQTLKRVVKPWLSLAPPWHRNFGSATESGTEPSKPIQSIESIGSRLHEPLGDLFPVSQWNDPSMLQPAFGVNVGQEWGMQIIANPNNAVQETSHSHQGICCRWRRDTASFYGEHGRK